MNNNIFDFAAKELSQDAVICWILNWLNDSGRKPPYFNLAASLMDKMRIPYAASLKEGIRIRQQYKSIDILVVIPEMHHVLLSEDKVYSTEHDDQLRRYKEALKKLSQRELQELELTHPLLDDDITVVYFKTGFFYDYCDTMVANSDIVDAVVSGPDFEYILSHFAGKKGTSGNL